MICSRVIRHEPFAPVPGSVSDVDLEPASGPAGLFLAFEGCEGVGKTTQARLIAIWLRDQGYDVVTTHEPGRDQDRDAAARDAARHR